MYLEYDTVIAERVCCSTPKRLPVVTSGPFKLALGASGEPGCPWSCFFAFFFVKNADDPPSRTVLSSQNAAKTCANTATGTHSFTIAVVELMFPILRLDVAKSHERGTAPTKCAVTPAEPA
jgi:hypothetical protein